MRMPALPTLRPLQRYAGRFWNTTQMMELLSIYYGAPAGAYPRTWQYRTLIAIHREKNSQSAYRKGYGPDWKSLVKVERDGKTWWVPDKGFAIKDDVTEYGMQGKVPLTALQTAAAHIRKVEYAVWVSRQIERETGVRALPIAAE